MRINWQIPAFLLFWCGVGRDDVPLEKYYQFARNISFECVGELYVKGHFTGSCVLIDQKYILTTAHSLFLESKNKIKDSIETPVGKKLIRRAAYTYLVRGSDLFVQIGGFRKTCTNIFVHPLYADSFRSSGNYDLALIELASPVPGLLLPEFYIGEAINQRVIAVGYGQVTTADDYYAKKKHNRVKMAGENMIDSTSKLCLWADMDHPRLGGFNRMGSDKPLSLEYIGNAGDCGSPLFIENENKFYLAGISFAPSYYSDMYTYGKLQGVNYGFITGWTNILELKDWIKSHLPKK